MSLQASDQRVPERVATIQAFVNVRRDNQPPFFINTPYGRAIRENQVINTTLLTVTATDSDLVVNLIYSYRISEHHKTLKSRNMLNANLLCTSLLCQFLNRVQSDMSPLESSLLRPSLKSTLYLEQSISSDLSEMMSF